MTGIFRSATDAFRERNGQDAEVLYLLPDIESEEPMCKVRFPDGFELAVFEDEVEGVALDAPDREALRNAIIEGSRPYKAK